MSSTTPLTDAINALTTYANEITGKSDETLSDAVESLVDGYGGGGGIRKVTGTITGNGKNTIGIPATSAPDVVFIYRSDFADMTAVSDRTASASFFYRNHFSGSCYTPANSTSTNDNGFSKFGDYGTSSNPGGNNKASFNNDTFYIQAGNNQNLWSSLLTYVYEFYYFS